MDKSKNILRIEKKTCNERYKVYMEMDNSSLDFPGMWPKGNDVDGCAGPVKSPVLGLGS